MILRQTARASIVAWAVYLACILVAVTGLQPRTPTRNTDSIHSFLSKPCQGRRPFLSSLLFIPVSIPLIALPSPSHAVRGAAELDLEYYARDLFRGNRREGSVAPSNPPPMPPPRTLKEPLLSMLLTEDSSCMPKQVLISMLDPTKTNDSASVEVEQQVQDRFLDYRSKAAKAFFARAPYAKESLDDQYYFDLSAYALWRTAADVLPNPRDRDAFVRTVGDRLYQRMVSQGLLAAPKDVGRLPIPLTATVPRVRAVLDELQAQGFLQSYRLTGASDTAGDEEVAVFDELDNQALQSGASLDCLLSILEPATLGAALQITAEQSRFSPDFVGPTVAAVLETAGVRCTWETYFVDNVYRPNPKDYFPNEQLIQFTITKT